MASLLIRSIRYLVTCDDKDQLLEDVDPTARTASSVRSAPIWTLPPTEPSTPTICCATPVW